MPYFQTVHIENNKRMERWHETREAAIDYLMVRHAMEVVDKLNKLKGHSVEFKAKTLIDCIGPLQDKMAMASEEVFEFIRKKE